MSNEFIHGSVGTSMTQAEFEAVGLHVLNSQATGDLIYASSISQLSRLGIGSTNDVLHVAGGIPAWSATLAGITLTSPTINGTIATTGLTMPAFAFTGQVTAYFGGGSQLIVGGSATDNIYIHDGSINGDWGNNAADTMHVNWLGYQGGATQFRSLILGNGKATPVLTIAGAATSVATWANCTLAGIVLSASEKINPVSGVAGFSVVSTALTLGSLGSVIIPQSAANASDALAGNVAGAICIDTTGAAERIYFRGASWFYVAKTGGLSMTKEERIAPNGHEFQIGDTVKLIVDRIEPDGSFHALPYLAV